MNRDEVDRALRHLRDERERIGTALLDLDGHTGYRLLEGGTLAGETARRQSEVRARMSSLWTLFDLYGRTLREAEDLRARHSRPGTDQLSKLTWLLSGPSVELPAEEVPLERRTLLAPKAERLSLDAVVQRMNPLYEQVARDVAALDDLWSALLTRLDEVEAARRAVAEKVDALGAPEPEYERAAGNLAAVARTVRADPLALIRDGSADTGGLDAVAADLAALDGRLAEAVRFRQGFDERMGRVHDAIGLVRAAEAEVRGARAEVLAKIVSPALPDAADRAPALADRLAALPVLRDRRRWGDLADRATELERAARDALERARADLRLTTGLLERRDELRGRLQAYKAKAARLGHAEDAELTGLYEEARAVLWTSPCDLRKATVMLSGYQQAISARTKGPGR
jgi:ABC-type transporter Mla subunit MlaD